MTKRYFDLYLSLVLIIFLLPLLLPIFIILLLTGEGYVFYFQERIGHNEKTFNLLKFATMYKDSPNMKGGNITSKNDPRILPFGNFLRKYKINEFPQLFNILKGDMSFIGRRPTVKEHYDFYSDDVKKIISKDKPGLSGISSIIFRNEEEFLIYDNNNNFYENKIAPFKGKLELWYSSNKSMSTDLLLVLTTICIVFNPTIKIYNVFFKSLPKHEIFNP